MKVFVNWDRILEEVTCVHTTRDGICDNCKSVSNKDKRKDIESYGEWFEVIVDN